MMPDELEIREVRPEERSWIEGIYRNAYRVDAAAAQRWAERIDLSTTRAFFDNERILSIIRIVPYTVVIGSKEMPMGGISGVATWADQQGQGLAGKLMAYSVGEMRRLGYPLSILYPFSYRYYGKFGWELCGRRVRYEFTQADVQKLDSTMSVSAVISESDRAAFREAYAKGFAVYNLLAKRSEKQWARHETVYGEDRRQAYVIRDAEGRARGCFVVADIPDPDESRFLARVTAMCVGDESWTTLFGFLASLPGSVKRIGLSAPEWPLLWRYFKEPTVQTTLQAHFQARVVDVERACQLRGYAPTAAGSVTFAITDPHGAWNESTWELHIESGAASISRTNASSEITLTIQQFSAIFTGFADPVEWVKAGWLPTQAAPAATTLRTIFHNRPTYLMDDF